MGQQPMPEWWTLFPAPMSEEERVWTYRTARDRIRALEAERDAAREAARHYQADYATAHKALNEVTQEAERLRSILRQFLQEPDGTEDGND